jgi:hypothetical protein
MFAVEIYAAVRKFVFIEGNSRREAVRVFGLSRDTIAKMCRYAARLCSIQACGAAKARAAGSGDRRNPGERQDGCAEAATYGEADLRPPSDRHGYAGGYTVVKDYVRLARTRSREVFIPLVHPPGHAQVDFGECTGVIGGVRMKLHVFCFDLPHSDACFKAYPAETTEAFLDGRLGLRLFWRGSDLDSLRQHKDSRGEDSGRRQAAPHPSLRRTRQPLPFSGSVRSTGQGNDKGKVEGLVKHSRLNFLTPCRILRPSRRSTPCWKSGVAPVRANAPAAVSERSANGLPRMRRSCAIRPPRLLNPIINARRRLCLLGTSARCWRAFRNSGRRLSRGMEK